MVLHADYIQRRKKLIILLLEFIIVGVEAHLYAVEYDGRFVTHRKQLRIFFSLPVGIEPFLRCSQVRGDIVSQCVDPYLTKFRYFEQARQPSCDYSCEHRGKESYESGFDLYTHCPHPRPNAPCEVLRV